MTDLNKNNKIDKPQNILIKKNFKIISSKSNDLTSIAYLYGMTLEEYEEGVEIHKKCFDQLRKIEAIASN